MATAAELRRQEQARLRAELAAQGERTAAARARTNAREQALEANRIAMEERRARRAQQRAALNEARRTRNSQAESLISSQIQNEIAAGGGRTRVGDQVVAPSVPFPEIAAQQGITLNPAQQAQIDPTMTRSRPAIQARPIDRVSQPSLGQLTGGGLDTTIGPPSVNQLTAGGLDTSAPGTPQVGGFNPPQFNLASLLGQGPTNPFPQPQQQQFNAFPSLSRRFGGGGFGGFGGVGSLGIGGLGGFGGFNPSPFPSFNVQSFSNPFTGFQPQLPQPDISAILGLLGGGPQPPQPTVTNQDMLLPSPFQQTGIGSPFGFSGGLQATQPSFNNPFSSALGFTNFLDQSGLGGFVPQSLPSFSQPTIQPQPSNTQIQDLQAQIDALTSAPLPVTGQPESPLMRPIDDRGGAGADRDGGGRGGLGGGGLRGGGLMEA